VLGQWNIRRFRWAGHVASVVETSNIHTILLEEPIGKRPFGRPRMRWKDDGSSS
jgi:hypothetical protein